jgi:signal transduction histidine kinase
MKVTNLSPRTAFIIFLGMVVFVMALAVWWVILMAHLAAEKVEIAQQLGATPEFVEQLHQQEISRQIMLGSEGSVFLLTILLGIWLIYRALHQTEVLRRRQENFLMAVTHELKTPLTSMGVYLDTLQSDKISAAKKQAVIPRIQQDVKRLEHLVDDILEAGRLETGEFNPNFQRVDLGTLLKSVADQFAGYSGAVALQLTREIESEVWAKVDAAIISRAIGAVLDNAVKYSGRSEAEIRISLRRLQHRAEISIKDNGAGISRSELRLVFERFYRIGHELTRAKGGTGLGLYLSREMIRAHGGDIVARSEGAGHGAEFIITLPLEKAR